MHFSAQTKFMESYWDTVRIELAWRAAILEYTERCTYCKQLQQQKKPRKEYESTECIYCGAPLRTVVQLLKREGK